jgi:uncharacterized protein DUF1761
MISALASINWLAVGLATLAYYALGAVWFTPLFGKAWDRSIGHTRTKGERFGAIYYVVPLVACVAVAVATAVLVEASGISSPLEAVVLGLVVGVGSSAAVSFTNAVNPSTPHPLLYGVVTGSYHAAGAVLVALIVVALP